MPTRLRAVRSMARSSLSRGYRAYSKGSRNSRRSQYRDDWPLTQAMPPSCTALGMLAARVVRCTSERLTGIYRLMVELADNGVALLVVSSELGEVIGICDRCLVIADGRLVDAFTREEGSEERVLCAVAAAQATSQKAIVSGVGA